MILFDQREPSVESRIFSNESVVANRKAIIGDLKSEITSGRLLSELGE